MNQREVGVPIFGLDYLMFAESALKAEQGNEIPRSIKIIIFSALAAEAFANHEIGEGECHGHRDKFIETEPVGKWMMLLKRRGIDKEFRNRIQRRLAVLFEQRGELVHFKSHKNYVAREMKPTGEVAICPDGTKVDYVQGKGEWLPIGVMEHLNIKQGKYLFDTVCLLIGAYYSEKKCWPAGAALVRFLNSQDERHPSLPGMECFGE